MRRTSVGRAANVSSRHWRGVGLFACVLIGMLVAPLDAQPSRSREDLVAKLAGKRVHLDEQTKRVRELTVEEARAFVATVLRVTERSQTSRPAPLQATVGRMLRLDDHAGHVIVARPNDDGSSALRCVGSADEAVAFLTEDPLPLQ